MKPLPLSSVQNISFSLKRNPRTIKQLLQSAPISPFPAPGSPTTNLFSVPMGLLFLDISYKWDHKTCDLSCNISCNPHTSCMGRPGEVEGFARDFSPIGSESECSSPCLKITFQPCVPCCLSWSSRLHYTKVLTPFLACLL